MPRYHNLSAEELEKIERFLEETDNDSWVVTDDDMRALIEKYWPSLLKKLPPPPSH
jgi:succinate dehydrogenase flavin-adding protein (antitoxin of CptAB toxin-antitoxin module)